MDEKGKTVSGGTEARKRQHIDTVLGANVAAKGVTTGFEIFAFEHCALPDLSLDDIGLSAALFGKTLRAPFLISSMTGGAAPARDINLKLAEAAQALGIAMGLGSQRAAIERPDLADTYQVRKAAPDIFLFANIGAVQFNKGYGVDEARRAVEMIEADALFLHLNPLQEAVQAEGDRDWRGLLSKIEKTVSQLSVPVVAKEVGNGISPSLAMALANAGVAAIDVAGAGGTSWSEVEAHRQPNPLIKRVAHSFAGWGIPTAVALHEAHRAMPELTLFASGGLRSGIDAAKAIRLGATLCGTAAPVLGSATRTAEAVFDSLSAYIEELRIACFCTGSADIAALRRAPLRDARSWSVLDI